MVTRPENTTSLSAHAVWDRTTRMFHWINVVLVFALATLGLTILNTKAFGISGDGKILLKTLHVYVGYGFALNLAWRVIWAFVGGPNARWRAILPVGPGFTVALKTYVRGLLSSKPPAYLGHNPLARLMVTLLLALLLVQAVTGLILAGTDLYKPPFGGAVAEWVTGGDPEKLANLVPGSEDFVDPVSFQSMRRFREPIVTTHLFVFYLLAATVLLHIGGVVIAEIRERHGLISAMFTGEKVFREYPVDMQAAERLTDPNHSPPNSDSASTKGVSS